MKSLYQESVNHLLYLIHLHTCPLDDDFVLQLKTPFIIVHLEQLFNYLTRETVGKKFAAG